MSWRVLDRDPVSGIVVWHNYDQVTKETQIYEVMDTERILEENKMLQTAGTSKGKFNAIDREGLKKGWNWVGRIPLTVLTAWKREGLDVIGDPSCTRRMLQKLDDPEFKHFRIGIGKLSR